MAFGVPENAKMVKIEQNPIKTSCYSCVDLANVIFKKDKSLSGFMLPAKMGNCVFPD